MQAPAIFRPKRKLKTGHATSTHAWVAWMFWPAILSSTPLWTAKHASSPQRVMLVMGRVCMTQMGMAYAILLKSKAALRRLPRILPQPPQRTMAPANFQVAPCQRRKTSIHLPTWTMVLRVLGCTDPLALNFNVLATESDNSHLSTAQFRRVGMGRNRRDGKWHARLSSVYIV